jgi:hypothetical protein
VPPDINEDTPPHPAGTFGEDGQSEIIRCRMMWYDDKKSTPWEEGPPSPEALPWLDVAARTIDPELGPVFVSTSAFGDYPTAIKSKGGKNNKYTEFVNNLGLNGVPPTSYGEKVGTKVIVEVKKRAYKGKVYADLAGIWVKP